MNINLRPHATSTSSHMSSNVYQVAMYPVVGYTRLVEGGPLVKLGWIFLSDDLGHDYHQVEVMDKTILDSFVKRFGRAPASWER